MNKNIDKKDRKFIYGINNYLGLLEIDDNDDDVFYIEYNKWMDVLELFLLGE